MSERLKTKRKATLWVKVVIAAAKVVVKVLAVVEAEVRGKATQVVGQPLRGINQVEAGLMLQR